MTMVGPGNSKVFEFSRTFQCRKTKTKGRHEILEHSSLFTTKQSNTYKKRRKRRFVEEIYEVTLYDVNVCITQN